MVKMLFHFTRCPDSDIPVEAATIAECTQKAFEERMKEITPRKIAGEIIE
jgi:hypothetical protein